MHWSLDSAQTIHPAEAERTKVAMETQPPLRSPKLPSLRGQLSLCDLLPCLLSHHSLFSPLWLVWGGFLCFWKQLFTWVLYSISSLYTLQSLLPLDWTACPGPRCRARLRTSPQLCRDGPGPPHLLCFTALPDLYLLSESGLLSFKTHTSCSLTKVKCFLTWRFVGINKKERNYIDGGIRAFSLQMKYKCRVPVWHQNY